MEMAKTVIGTPYYMSPELFRNQPYSFKSDIWSLGCVLFELVALRHAFEARDMNGLVQKIVRGSHAAIPAGAGKDMRALINSMLALAPGQRPTVTEILRMPFIRKEMSSYIQQQLGDSVAAELLRDDPKLAGFKEKEQEALEDQVGPPPPSEHDTYKTVRPDYGLGFQVKVITTFLCSTHLCVAAELLTTRRRRSRRPSRTRLALSCPTSPSSPSSSSPFSSLCFSLSLSVSHPHTHTRSLHLSSPSQTPPPQPSPPTPTPTP